MIISPVVKPLTGEELLNQIQKLDNLSREEKARYCGYFRIMEDGSEQIDIYDFIIAILKAKGIDLTLTEDNSQQIELIGTDLNFRISNSM